MSEKTAIEWCHHTFNCWWGCIEVSPACDNCYARTWATFTGHKVWGAAGETDRRFFGDKHWAEPLKWDRAAREAGERRRVFCASMADVFEQNTALDPYRARLWDLIDATPNLDWLLLTKRPQNIKRMVPTVWLEFPRANVWYGTTVENQHYADQRIPILLDVPAAVRFLSMEPLLGPVDLSVYFDPTGACCGGDESCYGNGHCLLTRWPRGEDGEYDGLDWIITGGESGKGARPAHPNWSRSLRDQCVTAGVAFHFKQWGEFITGEPDGSGFYRWQDPHRSWGNTILGVHRERRELSDGVIAERVGKKAAGRLLDGREWNEYPGAAAAPPAQPTTTDGGR